MLSQGEVVPGMLGSQARPASCAPKKPANPTETLNEEKLGTSGLLSGERVSCFFSQLLKTVK